MVAARLTDTNISRFINGIVVYILHKPSQHYLPIHQASGINFFVTWSFLIWETNDIVSLFWKFGNYYLSHKFPKWFATFIVSLALHYRKIKTHDHTSNAQGMYTIPNSKKSTLLCDLTSSFVSLVSLFGLGRRASLGALTLENANVLSCGGPPLGWPRTTTASPDNT